MSISKQIIEKIQHFHPVHHELINESHQHAGPATDSHFKLVLVSEAFVGVRAVARHQQVYRVLADELQGPVHALALHVYTPEEWQANQAVPESPNCLGLNA